MIRNSYLLGLSVFLCTAMPAFAQPQLTIEQVENNQVEISWPQSGDSYILEKASPLASPSVWVDIHA
ncbi:hypothetical protein N9C83_00795 [Opitutales bacterium]|nr:hypothetical protein [Opitutales bacterium]